MVKRVEQENNICKICVCVCFVLGKMGAVLGKVGKTELMSYKTGNKTGS